MLLSCHPILSTHSLKQLHRVKKALEVKTPVVFSLVFANNPILSCVFFQFFLIDLYFSIIAVIAETCNTNGNTN